METHPKAAVQLFVADGVGDELGDPAGGVHAHAGRAEDEVDVARVQLFARCVQQEKKKLISKIEFMSLCTAGRKKLISKTELMSLCTAGRKREKKLISKMELMSLCTAGKKLISKMDLMSLCTAGKKLISKLQLEYSSP